MSRLWCQVRGWGWKTCPHWDVSSCHLPEIPWCGGHAVLTPAFPVPHSGPSQHSHWTGTGRGKRGGGGQEPNQTQAAGEDTLEATGHWGMLHCFIRPLTKQNLRWQPRALNPKVGPLNIRPCVTGYTPWNCPCVGLVPVCTIHITWSCGKHPRIMQIVTGETNLSDIIYNLDNLNMGYQELIV